MDQYFPHSTAEWREFGLRMFALLIALTVHEFSHAKSAELAGDDTAKRMGRVTLNPIAHLDPVGTIMMIASSLSGFGLGWGKPVPVNHLRLRHPRWDNVKVSLWGPLSNLLTAFAFAMVVRLLARVAPDGLLEWYELLSAVIIVNLSLAVFNLIPLAPLDGSHILSGFLPPDQAYHFEQFNMRYGPLILLGIVFLVPDILSMIVGRPIILILKLFLGPYW
ncbi:MAG: site-2 protease family protein [Armatimonadota bacterium]|nr:site-2 protease family protein [Armatimonadota bacterium]